ncbi:hypothetical protein [Robiginitalea sediminis]|uniref:hypothetical protein n=1 Tax=Robiginitalea sediminis TaxID=1982593 RepID=UPI000B4C0CB8|nr:hypothetical protein [Robiginitalea sediminis]
MNSSLKTHIVRTGLALFLCGFAHHVLRAQELRQFSGTYQAGEWAGSATFQYTVQEKDTLIQGSFQMQSSPTENPLAGEEDSFLVKGNFVDHVPQGAWQFRFGTFQTDSVAERVGYQYKFNISGEEHEAIGLLSNGKPEGLWTHVVNQIRNSTLEKVQFRSAIRFQEGIPQRSFRIEGNGNALAGRLLRTGMAHDQWTLFSEASPGGEEHWYFQEGVLERVETLETGQWTSRSLDFAEAPQRRSVALDEAYLHFLNFAGMTPDSSGIVALLRENDRYYRRIKGLLSSFGSTVYRTGFQVQVGVYPFTPTEQAFLKDLEQWVSEAAAMSDRILNDPQLELARRSDPEAQYYFQVAGGLKARMINPLLHVVKLKQFGVLDFLPREALQGRLWTDTPEAKIPSEVPGYAYYEGPGADRLDFGGSGIASLRDMAQYAKGSLEEITAALGPRLTLEQQEQALLEREKSMVSQYEALKRLVSEPSESQERITTLALQAVLRQAESVVDGYSRLSYAEEKSVEIENAINCLENLGRLSRNLVQQQERSRQVREAYTDQIWNPFTATIMDEVVKRRITTAYFEVLLPYVLNEVGRNASCEKAKDWATLLEQTFERVLALKDEDTEKLERKLRKEKDPQTVIALFGLKEKAQE